MPILPAGPPPPGVHSNFNDPINRAPNLIACNVILLVVSTLVVGARILSRTLLTDWRLGWDDCKCSLHDYYLVTTKSANLYKTPLLWPLCVKTSENLVSKADQYLGRDGHFRLFCDRESVKTSPSSSWRLRNDADYRFSATHFGLGRHIWDVPMTTYTPQYLWVSASIQIPY